MARKLTEAVLIRVPRPDEPEDFTEKCRSPGLEWLAKNPKGDPHDMSSLWRPFLSPLRESYGGRCGVLAMFIRKGTVDHWLTIKNRRDLAFEWSNFRFLDANLNSAKKPAWDGKLLDPHEVQDGWFEIELPSLQLKISDSLTDPDLKAKAEFTLEKLHLQDGEDILQYRQAWLDLYESKDLTLVGLGKMAPLLARAVAKRDGLPDPTADRS